MTMHLCHSFGTLCIRGASFFLTLACMEHIKKRYFLFLNTLCSLVSVFANNLNIMKIYVAVSRIKKYRYGRCGLQFSMY